MSFPISDQWRGGRKSLLGIPFPLRDCSGSRVYVFLITRAASLPCQAGSFLLSALPDCHAAKGRCTHARANAGVILVGFQFRPLFLVHFTLLSGCPALGLAHSAARCIESADVLRGWG